MSRRSILMALLAIVLVVPVGAAAERTEAPAPRAVAGDYVVVLRAATTIQRPTGIGVVRRGRPARKALTSRVIDRASATGDRALRVRHRFSSTMAGFSASLSAAEVEALRADPDVLSVIPDVSIRASAAVQGPATLAPTADAPDVVPPGITRVGGQGPAAGVEVAILDTGIGSAADATMGGELNVVGGTDCVSGDGVTSTADGNFHGTHVAGTVGAAANQSGVVGVAPGVRLLAVRILGADGTGTGSDLICGIEWVTARKLANPSVPLVANMSLGGAWPYATPTTCPDPSDAIHTAICASVAAGVTYVVAAGNEATNTAGVVPARYTEVITVSAIADTDGAGGGLGARTGCGWSVDDDAMAPFSNYGSAVDLAAPGVCVRSTSYTTIGGTLTASGTSMAAPHVAGLAARYLAAHAGATPASVRAALVDAGTSDWRTSTDPDGTHERAAHVVVEPTPTPTPSPSPTPTPSPSASPSPSPTPSPTPTPSPSPSPTQSPSPSPTPTEAPTPGPTEVPTPGPTESPEPSDTPSPTEAPTPKPTDSPGPTESPEPTQDPDPTDSPEPSESPEPSTTPDPADGPVIDGLAITSVVALGEGSTGPVTVRLRTNAHASSRIVRHSVDVRSGSRWVTRATGASGQARLALRAGSVRIRVRVQDEEGRTTSKVLSTRIRLVDLRTSAASSASAWRQVRDRHAHRDTLLVGKRGGARVTVRVTGRLVALVAARDRTSGRVRVSLDGGARRTDATLRSSRTQRRVVVVQTRYGSSAHRVVTVTARSGVPRLDALVVIE